MAKLFRSSFIKSSRAAVNLRFRIHYRIELSFKTLAQAMYKDDQMHNRIERFYDNIWEKIVYSSKDEQQSIHLKAFINTSNLRQVGEAKLLISIDDQTVSEQIFFIEKSELEYAGWLELVYIPD